MNTFMRWIHTIGFIVAVPFLIVRAFVAALIQVVLMKLRLL